MLHLLRFLRFVGAALILLVPVAACADDGHLVIHSGDRAIAFNVEVVDTDAGREKGLMFRQSLAPDAGMLFDFKDSEQVAFWMQNTFIPLDMLFIAADGVIKTIHVNARPFDTTAIPSEVPVQFVLEIAGGRSAQLGIKVGDTVEHDRVKKAQ